MASLITGLKPGVNEAAEFLTFEAKLISVAKPQRGLCVPAKIKKAATGRPSQYELTISLVDRYRRAGAGHHLGLHRLG